MRLIQFRAPGPPGVLQCLDVPVPEPKPGEVLIRAHAIGVGVPDVLIRAGTYGFMPPLPATPGTELSGTIEKVGPGVTARRPGERVYTSARERPHRGGHYAEYVAAPVEATFLLPASVDLDAAAALANYQVAYHIFNDALRLRKGQSVLVYGAAGGMGNALIDLAKAADLTVIGAPAISGRITPSTAKTRRSASGSGRSRAAAASTPSSIRSRGRAFPTTSRCSRPAARSSSTARSAEARSSTCSRRCARAETRRRCGSSPSTPGTTSSRSAAPACAPSSTCSPPVSFGRASMPACRSPRRYGRTRCSRAARCWASCCCGREARTPAVIP